MSYQTHNSHIKKGATITQSKALRGGGESSNAHLPLQVTATLLDHAKKVGLAQHPASHSNQVDASRKPTKPRIKAVAPLAIVCPSI